MPGKNNVHYPHGTIESAGHSISGHADTLHNSASSASGITLPGNSLGSIGSSHASTLQSHISGVSGHISTMAEREGGHGDTLVQNSVNMRNTDSDHANQFALIHLGPSRNNLGSSDARPVGNQSSIEQLQGGAHHFTPTPGLAAGKAGAHTGVDNSWPAAPHQPPPGTTVMPEETHHHMGGEGKPGKGKKPKPSVVGGHVAASDYDPHYTPDPANPWKPPSGIPATGNTHGHGVNVPPGAGTTPAGTNGVYGVHNVPISDGAGGTLNHPTTGAPLNKPISTMFPQNVPSGQVWGMGEQAWNGGNPAFGHAGGQWQGHAQVPFTPVWNPHNEPGEPHGSGNGNSPHAGEIVNIAGYSRPMVPGDPTVHPATYFPNPPAAPPGGAGPAFPSVGQPPVPPPDPNWEDKSPKRTYDDPNYPGM